MASDFRKRRSGQAMTEFVIAILAIILVIAATVQFVPVFLDNIKLLKDVREEAGTKAISAESGTANADRRDEFSFDIPGIFEDDRFTSGNFSEKMYMPAGNLMSGAGAPVNIPPIPDLKIKLCYSGPFAEFCSGLIAMDAEDALENVRNCFGGWNMYEIRAYDALVFSRGDPIAPSAVAAVHAEPARDGNGTCVTVIARTAGGP